MASAGQGERVLFVLSRADDLAAVAGTAATVQARGGAVTVLTTVRGGADRLAEALKAVGVTDARWLGAAGARWPGRPERRYTDVGESAQTSWLESLEAADAGEVASDIAAAIDDVKPGVVVTYGDDAGDPDRARTRSAARAAADVLGVPVYAIERPDSRGGIRVNVAPAADRRAAAASALGVPPPSGSVERFRRVRSGAPRFQDYGLVSRIVTGVVAGLIGLFAGTLLTAVHQAVTPVAGVPVPWGLVAALLLTAALLAGLRVVFATRIVVAFAAAGLVIGAALLAVRTAGGSVPVPANPVGYLWTFAPLVIAAVVLLWPRTRSSVAQ